MRFGKWRGVPLALTLAAMLGWGMAKSVCADGWHLQYTIPREEQAYDYTTGGEYFAPPVPYGHYAKDDVGKAAGLFHGYLYGLFHHSGAGCGHGSGEGCGLGHNCGHGDSGNGCGFCAGRGLFHHGDGGFGEGCGTGSALSGLGGVSCPGSGLGHKKSFAPCHASTVAASSQAQPVGQSFVTPSGQSLCGDPGCKIGGPHSHPGSLACGICGGSGCGGCGLFGHGGTGCGLCGGKGCASCLCKLKNCVCQKAGCLTSKAHGAVDHLRGSVLGVLHPNKVDYFVGAGGPVPLTPGYVPYIVSTRSPRDFFAFPPMNPNDP